MHGWPFRPSCRPRKEAAEVASSGGRPGRRTSTIWPWPRRTALHDLGHGLDVVAQHPQPADERHGGIERAQAAVADAGGIAGQGVRGTEEQPAHGEHEQDRRQAAHDQGGHAGRQAGRQGQGIRWRPGPPSPASGPGPGRRAQVRRVRPGAKNRKIRPPGPCPGSRRQ